MESSKKEVKAKGAKAIAIEKMTNKDFKGARKFAVQAQKLCPNLENVVQMIHVCDVLCSGAQKVFDDERDWYKIINIDPTADMDSIKKQCQKMALILHPDKNRLPGAADAFQLLCEAKSVLMDYEKRRLFDTKCRANALSKNSKFSGGQKTTKARGSISKKKVAFPEKDGIFGGDDADIVRSVKRPKNGVSLSDIAEKQVDPQDKKAASLSNIAEKQVHPQDKEASKFASEPKKKSAKSSENSGEKLFLEYSDSEFNDFEKGRAKNCFDDGQIWAVYDTLDAMPRFYALINKVVSKDSRMDITWLEPCITPDNEEENKWLTQGLPASCGKFRHGCNEIIEDHAIFSHLVSWKKVINLGTFYEICPKKGETWALFKNWDIEWCCDEERRKDCDFEIVEILLDYCCGVGASVVYLGKVKGFVSIFSRINEQGTELSKVIEVKERLRFSHRVPSFQMTINAGENGDQRFFELDPASLPPKFTSNDLNLINYLI